MWVRVPLAWIISFNKIKYLRFNCQKKTKIKYSVKVTSIFSPGEASDSSLKINVHSKGTYSKKNKIMVKQSYLILTWLVYLAKIGCSGGFKNLKAGDEGKKLAVPLFFVCPFKQSKITTTKAPMAHKTFSQEQFKFRYYSFNISFNLINSDIVLNTNSVNKSLYLALLIRLNYINFSTNMMFLKRFRASLPVSDKSYFMI